MQKYSRGAGKTSNAKSAGGMLCQVEKRETSSAAARRQNSTAAAKAAAAGKGYLDFSQISALEEKSKKLLALAGNDFVQGLDGLSKFLAAVDPAPSALFQAIDQKGQDFATYYFAAFSDTRDVNVSLRIYKTIRSLVRYIVLMDRYYEIGNRKYKRMAAELLRSVKADSEGYLKYAIHFSFAQCWPFWDSEKLMKERMLEGCDFSYKEIRYHNMFKSSDAPTIYGRVLDSELENYNPNVSLVLHYNQALQDIQDDLDDLEEDLYDRMPNIFILGATESIPFSTLAANPDSIKEAVAKSKSLDKILDLVKEYENSAAGIALPSQYEFLKHLTHCYAGKLYESIRACKERVALVKVANPTVH
ncbi:Rossmann-fold NAD(P)-binding domain-containing protein [Nitrososphaera viennensis]|uniref:Uncharacterized protein n=2 Tax=Nitrososphaera viennensis TaxID=1034015 RepID=A0A060HJT1_9ARCH|nr:hypothetical protein [Nitrososphaera viennensis]AIC15773.1 hypothetical protein NVIE_015270 [Nitrososphaera viennensis EN76]UVS67771.1 hypothetical protein NWT39_07595 [Nitrososphaera viennensis]